MLQLLAAQYLGIYRTGAIPLEYRHVTSQKRDENEYRIHQNVAIKLQILQNLQSRTSKMQQSLLKLANLSQITLNMGEFQGCCAMQKYTEYATFMSQNEIRSIFQIPPSPTIL